MAQSFSAGTDHLTTTDNKRREIMATLTYCPHQSSEGFTFHADNSNQLRSAFKSISEQRLRYTTALSLNKENQDPIITIWIRSVDEDTVAVWSEMIDTMKGIDCRLEIRATLLSSPISAQSMDDLLKCLARIPSLCSFKFLPDVDETWDNVACMRLVSTVVRYSTTMRSLQCGIHMFEGTKGDFFNFAAAFLEHPSLELVYFSGCAISPDCHSAANTNLLLSSLATIPRLMSVSLSSGCIPPMKGATPKDLEPLFAVCEHPNLRSLQLLPSYTINGIAPREQPVLATVLPCIRNNTNLTGLVVQTSFEKEECKTLRDAIKVAGLDYLFLVIKQNDHGDPTEVSVVVEALRSDQLLSKLMFMITPSAKFFSKTEKEDFICMLRHSNFTLTEINFDFDLNPSTRHGQEDFLNEVNFYTKLNRLGRKGLLTSKSVPVEWVNFLVQVCDDVDAIFYVLSNKPNLCVV